MNKNEPNSYIITVLLLGLFGGSVAIVYLMARTFLSIDMAALYVLIFGALAFGLHFLFFRKDERYLIEVGLYSVLGWGMLLTTCMLAMNYFFHSPPVATTYVLKEGYQLDLAQKPAEFEITVREPDFNDFGYLLTFHEDEIKGNRFVNEAVITRAKGLFGYDVILKKELR